MHNGFKNAKPWVILSLTFDCPPVLGVGGHIHYYFFTSDNKYMSLQIPHRMF